jgi:hypothetical protein
MKRQQFSWELVKVLRHGVPGLWDIDFTGNKLSDNEVGFSGALGALGALCGTGRLFLARLLWTRSAGSCY